MGTVNLTTGQKEVYEYIRSYMDRNKHAPYIREIQDACQISSHKGVIDRLVALERKGYIKRKLNKHRSIKLNNR
jgi:repressor LexA